MKKEEFGSAHSFMRYFNTDSGKKKDHLSFVGNMTSVVLKDT